jgi:phospholipid/cholesterol/gamma-HCH transport system substrate-binding protein
MNRFSLEMKVGIFFLVALAIAGYVWFHVFDVTIKEGFPLKARFKSVEGLVQGAQVQIAGIKISTVRDISFDPETGKALVFMEVNEAYRNAIPVDSRILLRTKGLLGDKYIVVEPGKPNARKLKPGEEFSVVFEPTDTERVLESVGVVAQDIQALTREARKQIIEDKGSEKISSIINNTDDVAKDLKEILGKNKDKISRTMDNADNLAKVLNEIVNRNQEKVNRTMDDFERFSKNMDKTGEKFGKLASDLDGVTRDLKAGKGTLGKLMTDESLYRDAQALMGDARSLTSNIQRGPGAVGRLINDPELYYEARRAIRNMNKAAEDVSEATPISTLATILGAVLK